MADSTGDAVTDAVHDLAHLAHIWHYRFALLAVDLHAIHWNRNGYCDACGGEHPCLTLKALASASQARQ